MARLVILDRDGVVNEESADYIKSVLAEEVENGFFIKEIHLPVAVGLAVCGLYGPACGDAPVQESEVYYSNRGLDREWEDRMIDKGGRKCGFLQVIGVREGDHFKIFTAYGGPLAPQNPDDPRLLGSSGRSTHSVRIRNARADP